MERQIDYYRRCGTYPIAVAVNPVTNKIYVANYAATMSR